MGKYRHDLTLIEFFEKHNIDYKNENSHSFRNLWAGSIAPYDYKQRDILIAALMQRNSYLLSCSISKLCELFNIHLKNLRGVEGNEYFSLLLVNDYSFKSSVINRFGFAFHLKYLLQFYRRRFLKKEREKS